MEINKNLRGNDKQCISDAEILSLLSEILNNPIMETNTSTYPCIEERLTGPFSTKEIIWRYFVHNGQIIVEENNEVSSSKTRASRPQSPQRGSLQDFLWSRLSLERICERYRNSYKKWQKGNNNVPYIPTVIDGDSGGLWDSMSFIDNYLCQNEGGLHLLMAEYGMGKSSFCQGIRQRVSEIVEDDKPAVYKLFSEGQSAFPFVFNLNEYRERDFDQFIQNKLFEDYGISLRFRTFERLCRAGIFTVVLDAWDQMHGTPRQQQVVRDISQFASLWGEKGSVLITCRRSFYQSQLHAKGNGLFGQGAMETASLYTICSFGFNEAKEYFNSVYTASPAQLAKPDLWLDEAWKMNYEFLSRPLNVQLLAKYYDSFCKSHDLQRQDFDTRDLLEVVLDRWLYKGMNIVASKEQKTGLLRQLTMLTLESGLNRSIRLSYLFSKIAGSLSASDPEEKSALIQSLQNELADLELVSIQKDNVVPEYDTVEFRLAAYQEFLWAHFVVQELRERRICQEGTLLHRHLLNPETRIWVAKTFQKEESDVLSVQINMLAYKSFADTGYSGGNALTILGDLNRIPYYKQQVLALHLTDRPLQGADLHGLNLSGLAFRRSNLREANFSYTKLEGTDFSGADLTDARWDEYGKIQRCAFLNMSEGSNAGASVVSGTERGGVLTFNLATQKQELVDLAEEEIREIAADSAGVYTAGSDGYVGYIDSEGTLKNAYIASNGLQSITSGAPKTIYVGVDQEGLTCYNWKRGSRQHIHVADLDGNTKELKTVFDIHYWETDGERYIAYTTEDRKKLVLLMLVGMDSASEVGEGRLMGELRFSDICFADQNLVYAVPGRGIFSVEINTFFDQWDANALLSEDRLLCPVGHDSVELAWIKEKKRVLAVVKDSNSVTSLLSLSYEQKTSSKQTAPDILDLEWVFDGYNYAVMGTQINGFCASKDGAYVALAGERLAVFTWEDDYYTLIQPPIEANIMCNGANFLGCEGVQKEVLVKFQKRGAMI